MFYIKFIKTFSGCSAMKAKELAKKLGVSPATISLVLNNKPGISDSLRQSLLNKIEELGCGEMMCRSCRAGEAPGTSEEDVSRKAIVYLSYLSCQAWDDPDSFFPGVLEGAESEARYRNYDFSVFHMACQKDPLSQLLSHCGDVIGFIVQSEGMTPQIQSDLQNINLPCVFMDNYDPRQSVSSVRVDNLEAMHTIVSYLKEKGHRDIGYVRTGWESGWQHNRFHAYRSALNLLELEYEPGFVFQATIGDDIWAYQCLAEAFSQAPKLPTALVCENDRQAVRSINALRQLGLKVPEDVSVVGFDDRPFSSAICPKLTTVRNSCQLMGRECVILLENLRRLKELELPLPNIKYALPVTLVERDSVRDLNKTK